MNIAEIVEVMDEKAQRLKELKAQSPEVEEALRLTDDYQQLLVALTQHCQPATPAIVPLPYYVPYPSPYPYWYYEQPYRTWTSDRTITIQAVQ